MTIQEQQDEIIADFELFSDWMDKYEYIIQLGRDLPLIDPQYKTDDNSSLIFLQKFQKNKN